MTHPYGQQTWNITTPGVRAVNESFDIQFAPGVAGQQGRVGPWLRSIQDPNNPGDTPIPAGFIGDGLPRKADGSPCGTNFIRVSALAPDGVTPLVIDPGDTDGDGSESSVTTDLFTVNGKIWDGRLA